ncbi:MAG: DUF6279 family lipoprotein [Pseudomonadota bacterium]
MKLAVRLILILALVLSTSACGLRLAYNHLDWLAMRWVNKQVTLNAAQEMAFRDALEMKLDWHCANELPDYVPFLESARSTLSAETLTTDDLEQMGEQVAVFGQRLIDRTMPSVVTLFASLDDDQVQELLDGVDERNEDFKEERVDPSPEQRQREQIESMKGSLGRFIGRTTSEQEARLQEWSESLLFVAPRMHSHQQQWRDKFADLLARRDDEETFGPALIELFQPAGDWSDDFREVMEFNRQRTLEAMVDIHASLTRRQQRRMLGRLESLQDDFERLSCSNESI